MDIIQLNKPYKANNNNGIVVTDVNYKVIKGLRPFILSAPHAVRQFRNGEIKASEQFTGGIVEAATQETNTHGIIRTYNLNDDPNYDDIGPGLAYKNKMIELINDNNIHYAFDIHGCSDNHDFDIDIGTNNGLNINNLKVEVEVIEAILSRLGKVTIDNKFKAHNPNNISNYVHSKTNIPCFQIEISKSIRLYTPYKLVHSLKEIFDEIESQKR